MSAFMDLAAHFRVIAENWLRIVVISAVIAVAVFLASGLRADTYEAKDVLTVRARDGPGRPVRAGRGELPRPDLRRSTSRPAA